MPLVPDAEERDDKARAEDQENEGCQFQQRKRMPSNENKLSDRRRERARIRLELL